MITLDDAYAKLKGCKKRLPLLESDIEALGSGKAEPYIITNKQDRSNANAFRSKDANPLLPLSAEIGSLLVDYRAALNSTIHSLYELNTGKTLGKNEKRDFPICKSRQDFNSRQSALKGLRTDHIAIVEKAQPYNGHHVLLRLIDSNEHKHRKGGVFIRATGGARLHAFIPPPNQNTTIETLVFPGNRHVPKTMYMEAYVCGEITFSDGAPVIDTLHAIHAEVTCILGTFEPFFD